MDGGDAVTARVLFGLLIPADPDRPIAVCTLEDSTLAISDLLGGVLLDDPATWGLGQGVFAAACMAEDRAGLPINQRLSVVATRLGILGRTFHAAARGDALILGTRANRDTDVPPAVVAATGRCGYQVVTGHAALTAPTS